MKLTARTSAGTMAQLIGSSYFEPERIEVEEGPGPWAVTPREDGSVHVLIDPHQLMADGRQARIRLSALFASAVEGFFSAAS